MDIFDKIKPQRQELDQPVEEKVGSVFVKKGDTYFCVQPKKIDYFSEGQTKVFEKAQSTFTSRYRARSFYRKTTYYLDSDLKEYMLDMLVDKKTFDYDCLSIEKQRELFLLASKSIDMVNFLHKTGFDFDNVIRNSCFEKDFSELGSYSWIIPCIKDKNVCDKNGMPLLVAVSSASNFIQVLRYNAKTDFVVNGKTLKDIIINQKPTEIAEVAFAHGLIGLTRDEVMSMERIRSPRCRFCPFLDMLKTEILETEKGKSDSVSKISTKKELSPKAEIEALFESAQTIIK